MVRVRADYVFGTLDAALSDAGTTLSSPTLARLPVITGPDVAALVLGDPATGTYEIVHVTAHADAATTATITRALEGSTAASWASGAAWWHGPTVLDFAAPDVDPVTVPTSLLSDKYQGAWDPDRTGGSQYAAGQTVVFESKLWEALVDDPNVTTPDGPTTDVPAEDPGDTGGYVGSADDAGADLGAPCAAQRTTFPAAGAITAVRARFTGTGSLDIGYATAQPAKPNEVVWLGHAIVPAAATEGDWTPDVELDTPIPVTAGQQLWMIANGAGSTRPNVKAGLTPTVGDAVLDSLSYAPEPSATYQSGTLAYQAIVQAVLGAGDGGAAEPVWGLALDFSS